MRRPITALRAASFAAIAAAFTVSAAPGVARAADFTWSGAASTPNWSVPGNWAGSASPGGSVGELAFPALSSPACAASPPAASCYESMNDSSVSANSINVDDGAGYVISGNQILLGGGGITAAPSTADPASAGGSDPTLTLSAPLNLQGQQSWSFTGGASDPLVLIGGAVSGSDSLTIDLNDQVSLAFTSANVGEVTVTGDGDPQDGAIQVGSLDKSGTLTAGSLNATDAQPVSFFEGAGLFALDGSIGPLFIASGIVQVGEDDRAGELTVAGSASIDPQSELFAYINGPGTTAGSDFSQLKATGDVNLAGASLLLGDGVGNDGVCGQLNPGDVDTIITSNGTLTGQFTNAPDASTITLDCFGSGATPPTARINYLGNTVTATVISAGTPPAATTTTLAIDPADPATNQPVTLTATVTPGTGASNGTVDFSNAGAAIGGCQDVVAEVVGDSYTATCQTAFAAAAPPSVTATFTPGAGSTIAGSASPALTPPVARGSTTTTVTVSPSLVSLNQAAVYTATVTANQTGATVPTGAVAFLVNGQPLAQGATGTASCAGVPLRAGPASASAACTETFTTGTGTEPFAITATYSGDQNFTGSASGPQTVTVAGPPAPVPARGKIGRAAFGRASATATMADLIVTCKGSRGQRCTVTIKLTSREKTKRGRLVAATAAKTTERTVTVGTRTLTLAAGLGETVHVKLNAAARRALKALRKLPVTVAATQRTSTGTSRATLRHVTFKASR
ncbi:MAG TPA: Ig-like domain-containing protein [Solirubrobacteraceae bacterium]